MYICVCVSVCVFVCTSVLWKTLEIISPESIDNDRMIIDNAMLLSHEYLMMDEFM